MDNEYQHSVITAMKICNDNGMLYRHDNQWYLDMRSLAKRILDSYHNDEIQIIPETSGKTLCNFLENIEPWCISRQIYWGHRIPIWYSHDGQKWGVFLSEEEAKHSLGLNCYQDNDVLDTWFSSALWPFAIFGWPQQTEDYKRYYPCDIIETAGDILFFWCARMLMMGLLLTDRLPFKKIYLHGIIRDSSGRKMAKSLGNGIEPSTIIQNYGVDAMRFGLCEYTRPGIDLDISNHIWENARKFANKVWQGSKFTISHYRRIGEPMITQTDGELIDELRQIQEKYIEYMDEYDFGKTALLLKTFFKDNYCDIWIEKNKDNFYGNDRELINQSMYGLRIYLKMLHPFMPFITERLWMAMAPGLIANAIL